MEAKTATTVKTTVPPALPTRVSIPAEVVFQTLHGECVLLNMASETYYGLDEVGARMWELMAEHGDIAVVLDHLRSYYDADEAVLSRDLAALIATLHAERLITL
ncbi:MAG TPA: PqqD family protein [Blastocatellia bacterium]|nr:PqqD family protein [Blastocatellia bacterium]